MWQQIVKSWLKREDIDRPQAWLARKASCSASYLSLCLRGRLEPTNGFLYGLEAAMGIPRGGLVEARKRVQEDEYRRPAATPTEGR